MVTDRNRERHHYRNGCAVRDCVTGSQRLALGAVYGILVTLLLVLVDSVAELGTLISTARTNSGDCWTHAAVFYPVVVLVLAITVLVLFVWKLSVSLTSSRTAEKGAGLSVDAAMPVRHAERLS